MDTKNTPKVTVKRLTYVCDMLAKYGHCWGENPSDRMYNWVDEYNAARNTTVWVEYCTARGFTLDHDAYDCMA